MSVDSTVRREYVDKIPAAPVSDEVLTTGLTDILAQLGWYLAAAGEDRQPLVDQAVIALEHVISAVREQA